MNILLTGCAGFIGAALARLLLSLGFRVLGIDNLNAYYDANLKRDRLNLLQDMAGFEFMHADIADRALMEKIFAENTFDAVVHLAAQAGVRYSIDNPHAYIDANLVGFGNILECCRQNQIKHLAFASSSSIYGDGEPPFRETDSAERPVSLYAASKRANELMAHSYAHLYRLPCTALRFFTVYGPWGRPDMAFFKFAHLMLRGEKIPLYNRGELSRDFTYIEDAARAVHLILDKPPTADAPYRVYNIGNGRQVALRDYVCALEDALGVKAECELLPMQPGDVHATCADIGALKRDFDFTPKVSHAEGLVKFAAWYRDYYADNA